MTERAFIREKYKRKKRLPAPEVAKPKGTHKPEKNIFLQCRYTAEYVAEVNKRADEYGVKKEVIGKRWMKITCWRIESNEWRTEGKYVDIETAEMVLSKQKLHHPAFWKNYEYRIISKDDLKKEKYEQRNIRQTTPTN